MHRPWIQTTRRSSLSRFILCLAGAAFLCVYLLRTINNRDTATTIRAMELWPILLAPADKNLPLRKWLQSYLPKIYPDETENRISVFEKPQIMLRDNLLPDKRYTIWMTSSRGGFGNQQMALFRGLSLAKDMDRIAIIPGIGDVHVTRLFNETAPPERWDTYFDMPRFFKDSGWSNVVQREDMKQFCPTDCGTREPLHCYAIHHPFDLARVADYSSFDLAQFNLQFEPLPHSITEEYDVTRAPKIQQFHANRSETDKQLLCYDTPFFALDSPEPDLKNCDSCKPYGFAGWLSPQLRSWQQIGRHFRFDRRLDAIVDDILWRHHLKTNQEFAAVHIRRGDFVEYGITKRSTGDFVRAMEKLQAQWRDMKTKRLTADSTSSSDIDAHSVAVDPPTRHPLEAPRRTGKARTVAAPSKLTVLVTTNENRPEELAAMRAAGWYVMIHEDLFTEEYGPWYPTVVDSVIQARAKIFVGDVKSTMSELSALRVREWNHGLAVLI